MASWRFLPWPGRVGDLAISIRGLRENDRWRMLADLDGQPFSSWEDFCQYPEPYGLGLSLDQVEAILDRSNAGKRLSAVLGGHGGDRRSPEARKDQGSRRTLKRGETSEYLEARLRRSHKDIATAYDRGEFKSLKAAAREAGIVKDPDPPQGAQALVGPGLRPSARTLHGLHRAVARGARRRRTTKRPPTIRALRGRRPSGLAHEGSAAQKGKAPTSPT